jgi:type IV pilus assembly protein PilW
VPAGRRSTHGFSLVELMIAITLGFLVLTGLVSAFVNSSRTRDEIERTSQQIENGRYASEVLGTEFRLAGYWAELNLATASGSGGLANPPSKPDACATAALDLQSAIPLHIQGYDQGANAPLCLTDVKPNTDILVVRRVSTCARGAPDCATVTGAPYFQASLCNNLPTAELATTPAAGNWFKVSTDPAALTLHRRDCTALADLRQFVTRIYFIANNDAALDGIPTLKRAELAAGVFNVVSVASGIDNLQLEYGLDNNGFGVPDDINANPDTYAGCPGGTASCVVTNWQKVVTVKVYLLARNTTKSSGYSDSKTYTLGRNADGTANTVGPFGDPYRRHAYQMEVRLSNAAGRKE